MWKSSCSQTVCQGIEIVFHELHSYRTLKWLLANNEKILAILAPVASILEPDILVLCQGIMLFLNILLRLAHFT
jgi:hypothetical protein